jgi:phenylalanyl-tRNA synthetase beta subunit
MHNTLQLCLHIFAFELNINELPSSKERYGKRSEYITSDYQMITRDYAFIVDQSLPVADLLNFLLEMK